MVNEEKLVDYLRRVTSDLHSTRARLREVEERSQEPVAVVSMACRYPGGVSSPEDLWRLVAAAESAIGEFPTDRGWDLENLFHPDPDHAGTSYARQGGFLYEAAEFDPEFFGISPREALAIDPQQRLLLETSWELLERAGIDPHTLKGSPTGVYAGAALPGFGTPHIERSAEGYLVTGNAPSVLSGRVSYTLGLEGPAVTVDTACSSSLVAMHLAAQALRQGECSLALAGGVTVMTIPNVFTEFARQRGLAADSRCKAFAAAADGTAFSEGVGLVLLERLSDAQRNGHEVLAVIRGSAINQDGASNGLTAPNGPSQQRVIGQALANARLAPGDIDAVEAHGTGTRLGDPIEAHALLTTYGPDRPADQPLWLGSVKSNIGHTQGAAGAAGVIKMIMAMREQELPRTLHVDAPTPHVDWGSGNVRLLTEPVPWPRTERPRRAAVSSFGISGTNAHLILEQPPAAAETAPAAAQDAPAAEQPTAGNATTEQPAAEQPTAGKPTAEGDADSAAPPLPWVLSGRTEQALYDQARALADHLAARPALTPGDIGWSLARTRSAFEHRAVLVGATRAQLTEALHALADGRPHPDLTRAAGPTRPGDTAFLFTGQGSQYPGMGRELYAAYPEFAAAVDAACAHFDPLLGISLREAIFAADSPEPGPAAESKEAVEAGQAPGADETTGEATHPVHQTGLTQAALFTVETALYRLVTSLGYAPDYLTGHSVGEIVAAHVAGVLSLEDACTLVAARGRLMQALPAGGAMIAIEATAGQVEELLAGRTDRASLAAVNGPTAVVLSGDQDVVEEIAQTLRARGHKTKRLRVSHAFHSPRLDPMLDAFREVAAGLTYHAPNLPVISNLTGELVGAGHLTDPEYWVRHVREPVRFHDGLRTLHREGVVRYLELGPDAVLATMAQAVLTTAEGQAEPAFATVLRKGREEPRTLLTALAHLHNDGGTVDFAAALPAGARPVPLPTYRFQRQRYWRPVPDTTGDVRAAGLGATEHPLLSAVVEPADGGLLLTGRLSLRTHPWLADHTIQGTVPLPGTAFLELALLAAGRAGCDLVDDLTLEAPLIVPASGAVQVQLAVGAPDAAGRRPIAVHSRPAEEETTATGTAGTWRHHATGVIATAPGATPVTQADTPWPPAGAEPIDVADLYQRLTDQGYAYGPAFRGLHAAWRSGQDVLAEVRLNAEQRADATAYGLHPALLDSVLHPLEELWGTGHHAPQQPRTVRLPFTFGGVRLHATGAARLRVRLTPTAADQVRLELADQQGNPVATVQQLGVREIPADQWRAARTVDDTLYRLDWLPHPAPQPVPVDGHWALVGTGLDLELPTDGGTGSTSRHADAAALGAALAAGAEPPTTVLLLCPAQQDGEPAPDAPAGQLPDQVRAAAHRALDELQTLLADAQLTAARLVVTTRGAVQTHPDEPPADLTTAPVWGLVRSAQAEHPGRLLLLDTDDDPASLHALPALVTAAVAGAEDEVALRAGAARVPRLTPFRPDPQTTAPALDPDGTVLITGGTGALGRQVARHLLTVHGARHLLLVSRSGQAAPGIDAFTTELAALAADAGQQAEVTVAACDTADPAALATLLDAIPSAHPLTAVLHTAGVLDDGVIDTLTPARLDAVLAPKLDAAWHLHHLTREHAPAVFALFSSAASVVRSGGQANYAAANAFLNALAEHRRAQGLPGTALAWGLWGSAGGMTENLSEADLARMTRSGVAAVPPEQALALLDAALTTPHATVLPARFDLGVLRDQARSAPLAPALRRLVPATPRAAATSGGDDATTFAARLAGLSTADQDRLVAELVREQIGTVIAHPAPETIDLGRAFQELGFDSLTALDLRNRLSASTGIRVAATVIFDYPTPDALVAMLRTELTGAAATVRLPAATPKVSDADPIVIVGMACQYPGGVNSPEDLWRLVASGTDAIGPFPTGRGWPLGELFDPDPDHTGTSYADEGGFLHDADRFDAGFFGISPREALATDPQQRLLLETAWQTFESAGIDPASVRGSQCAVITGVMYDDYGSRFIGRAPEGVEGRLMTGSTPSVASGRVAFTFGLEGPAMTVDTACSSSLVALHLAAQALRQGECTLALAGGVTVMATPNTFVEFSRQRGLAADGRCKPFAAAADGTGWGEGVGLLLLERLSDARRNGHRPLAVIRGSAINQDGASNGLTAPNGPSQQRVIGQALASAGLTTADVDAVEAHGTGTTLGDPIEAQALLATYGQDRPAEDPLWLGSIKSNIGHTQAAAGVAGIIKMVQAMRHGILPASLHIDAPSPHVDWEAGAVRLLTEPTPWPERDRPRRAGVSSFGISGTNAHIIVEQVPEPTPLHPDAPSTASHRTPSDTTDDAAHDVPQTTADGAAQAPEHDAPQDARRDTADGLPQEQGQQQEQGQDRGHSQPAEAIVPWVISGRDPQALRDQAAALTRHLARHPDLDLADVGWSLATTRAVFDHRAVVVGQDRDELLVGLEALAAGETYPGLVGPETPATGATTTGPVLVFPGQGSQWVGMGAGLLEASPVFAARVAECEQALAPYVDWSLTEVLRGGVDAAELSRVDVVQPVLWAVMVSLAEVWSHQGVTPGAVVGHSQGEIAAAVVAGALTLADGAKVVALRSKALRRLAGGGAMASLALREEAVVELLADLGEAAAGVSIAAVNGPGSVVVSGPPEQVRHAVTHCEESGGRARLIDVDYASHSPQVDEIADELHELLAGIQPTSTSLPFYSTVTAERIDTSELTTAYWVTNLRERVRFADAVRALLAAGHRVFIEASTHPVLTVGLQETLEESGTAGATVPTLRRDQGGPAQLVRSVGQAFTAGVAVDWTPWFATGRRPRVIDLPTYAFQRASYWLDADRDPLGDLSDVGLTAAGHPLLGAAVEVADGSTHVLTGRITLSAHPWLADHTVAGTVLVPGAALAEWALRAADEVGCGGVDELTLQAPLVLPADGALRLQVVVTAATPDGRRDVRLYARPDREAGHHDAWTCHAEGVLAPPAPAGEGGQELAGSWPPAGAEPLPVDAFHAQVAAAGYGYGPAFQGLTALWRHGPDVLAEVELPDAAGAPDGFGLHPALLDAALHPARLLTGPGEATGQPSEQTAEPADRLWLPFAWHGLTLWATDARTLRVRLTPGAATTDDERSLQVVVADAVGAPVLSADALVLRAARPDQLRTAGAPGTDGLYTLEWGPVVAPSDTDEAPGRSATGGWAVLGTDTFQLAGLPVPDGSTVGAHPDVAALTAALDAGTPVPTTALLSAVPEAGTEARTVPEAAGAGLALTQRVLALVQDWLAEPRLLDTRLVIVTRGAVSTDDTDPGTAGDAPRTSATDPAAAGVWGLIRSAEAENPGRFVLLDLDPAAEADAQAPVEAVLRAVDLDEPQLALRTGRVLAPRMRRAGAIGSELVGPAATTAWRLASEGTATVDSVVPLACPEVLEPLAAGQVRIAVHAAGINFRDVLIALGMYPGNGVFRGSEGAGTITEIGPGVTELAPGDTVFGLFEGAFGPLAVADARLVAPLPTGLGLRELAAVPTVFLTAWYGLVDLGGLVAGESVLIHAGTGGVGMAAVQIARHLGAEVFATASPAKHGVLEELGVDVGHRANSRDLGFESVIREATGGRGVDVVLNSLAGDFVDASLRLLTDGGRFVEMGKTDIRPQAEIAENHPGVHYTAFDLVPDAGPDRVGEMLRTVRDLLVSHVLRPAPVTGWPLARARQALRHLSQAKHTGKLVLDVPAAVDPEGTVLITGGTGTLGALVAEHLVRAHGLRHLLLVSRRGPAAEGAEALAARLAELGAKPRIVAADVADATAVADLIAGIDPAHPLTGVIHATGVLDDAVIAFQNPERLERVWQAKAAGAANLHAATAGHRLGLFVIFSSAAGTLGGPGQANYSAANAFCDALAAHRRDLGLPGVSIAWGLWADASGMTGHLADADLARMSRSGINPIATPHGLALLDAATGHGAPHLIAADLDLRALADQPTEALSAPLRGLATPAPTGARTRRTASTTAEPDTADWAGKLAGLPAAEQQRTLLTLVRTHAATVLGHPDVDAVPADASFKELGFDSLTAVELRNRLSAATGLRLPAALVFDYPEATVMADYLLQRIAPADEAPAGPDAADPVLGELARLEHTLGALALDDEGRARIAKRLAGLLSKVNEESADAPGGSDFSDIDSASDDEMFALIDRELP
ncbi:SDR family NAD(P)-dependent oxidoreductase [Streptomyces sp. 796.1]|uniref:SDR family NAD(P)-dependent oxidoreductase n=1 Tax=Streptomyces sp. 796.1 TaxID=3163029 RepID=UPI0039C98805